ncbi:MAG: hypothetical protein OXH38_07595 [Chloroflexi bacterium]|nr:hypothetical protein [Chloroflexota bacterium]
METPTTSERPWTALERLARGAELILIVAPYIKVDTLRRVLALVSAQALLTCVTRWQRADIVAGVSDVACRTLVAERGGRFLLNQRLHAKYYRLGDAVLVGSANLTAAGMGYGSSPNVEILSEPGSRFDPGAFERELLKNAREVSDVEFERWNALEQVPAAATAVAKPDEPNEWRPMAREPEHVWLAYRGATAAVVSGDERLRAARDLAALRLPPGLDRSGFDVIVGAELLSSAAIADVLRTDGLPDEVAWTQLAEKWSTTRSEAQRFRETAWNWIVTVIGDTPPSPEA